ncbi:hypothetical protein DL768_001332 [Monosporascus sp. mg162]|nr:hypothetical protein DL768_001332 [Monosporascus sp. mg162]
MTNSKIRVVDTGITCLHPGGDNPKADLVFVHGLGGHPQKTWSTEPCEPKTSAERGVPIGKRIANRLLRRANRVAAGNDKTLPGVSESSVNQEVFWPRDLLPENVKDVRVMTFGYYSSPGGSSQDNLYTLSKSLLGKLANERTYAALKISQDSTSGDAWLKTIRDSTRGVIFFGTPHSGSDMANWGELLRRIAGIFAVTNSTLLAALNSENDNGQLEELRKNFSRMLGQSSDGKFRVFSFRETKPLVNGPMEWASDLTVPENHRDICKFGGPNDPRYIDFVNELQRFLREIGEGAGVKRHYAVPVETVQSYTERSKLWEELEEKLQIRHGKASVPYAVTIHGFGGAGKSQLALKYAERKKDRYNPILWIDATDEEAVRSSFRRCAAELGLSDDQDENRTSALADNGALQRVLRWLRDRKEIDDEWLVIVDNADDFSWGIKEAMPKGGQGSIIITSQDNWSHMLIPGGCEHIEVGVMSPQEGTTLLLQRLDLDKEAVTETIRMRCAKVADELGYLPLAIDLAGAYIGNDSAPPEIALRQYLEDYTTHRDELLKKDEFQGLMGTKKTVWTVWDTTLQRITKDTVQPRLLLRFLAQFKGTIIQDEMFGLAALGTPLLDDGLADEISIELRRFLPVNGGKWDSFLYRQCRDLLVRYGLLQRVEGDWPGVTMHKKEEHHPEFRRHLVVHLPAVDRVFSDMGGNTERYRDFVGSTFGTVYYDEGRWEEAEKLFVQVMETCQTNLGVDHPDTLTSMANLASTLCKQGRWEEAEKLEVQVIETSKTKLGADHPDTLTSMANLASTLCKQGRWEKAEKLKVQVMETRRTKLGADHPDTLTSMANLASTLWKQGRWEEAEKLFVQVMEIRRTKVGADHPDTLISINNLASTLCDQGRWEEAEKLEVQVIETCRTKLGADHPNTLTSMAGLASTLRSQGRWEEAEKLEVQVMEMSKTKLGADHPDTLTSMANLASTLWNQGRWEEAEKLEVQVMETRNTKLGADHPHTLTSMNNLAFTWKTQGRFGDALDLMQECCSFTARVLGPEHPDTISSMSVLRAWQREQDLYGASTTTSTRTSE